MIDKILAARQVDDLPEFPALDISAYHWAEDAGHFIPLAGYLISFSEEEDYNLEQYVNQNIIPLDFMVGEKQYSGLLTFGKFGLPKETFKPPVGTKSSTFASEGSLHEWIYLGAFKREGGKDLDIILSRRLKIKSRKYAPWPLSLQVRVLKCFQGK